MADRDPVWRSPAVRAGLLWLIAGVAGWSGVQAAGAFDRLRSLEIVAAEKAATDRATAAEISRLADDVAAIRLRLESVASARP